MTSLRVQLTNAALNDDKLKAKANRIPLYQPRNKVNEASLKQLYQSKVFRPDSLNEEHKRKLDTELQDVLKTQLLRVEDDLKRKHIQETEIQQELELELSESLRQQLSSVLRSLEPASQTELEDKMKKMTKSEIQDSLEVQLRSIFGR